MNYQATRQNIPNFGTPPTAFLDEIISWAKTADLAIFNVNDNDADIYASVYSALGPWAGLEHRTAVMLEVLRVLGGFESSWNWNEGVDTHKKEPDRPETAEAGLWQVSANSRQWGHELKALIMKTIGSFDPDAFQKEIKENHQFAMEYTSRLLRRTVKTHGPINRGDIHPYLSRDAVKEFQAFLEK